MPAVRGALQMTFDPTVTLGTLLQIIVFLSGGVFAFMRVQNKLELLAQRVESLEKTSSNIGSILQQVAVQSQRLTPLEDDLRELRHGRGFVRGRAGIDGEYPS
jgi:K+/H+ antiporter YhaU regulatory subunit KhtT